jgi:hypothetical protein
LFEQVGNNNLVFFTNTPAMELCETHPDTIQGNIIDDYWCRIHPEAVVVGSFIKGHAGSHGCGPSVGNVDFGSQVFYSNVSGGHVRRSKVVRSAVMGELERSTIADSIVGGSLRNMHLTRCAAISGAIADETAEDFIFEYDKRRDHPDTNGLVAKLLERHRLRMAPHLVGVSS